MVMISPCSIILVQVGIDPIFVGSNGLFAVIAYNNGRNTAKIVQCMVVDLNPLGFTGGDHPFCIDILRIGQNCYKHNNGRDLAGKFVDQLKSFACKVNFHLLSDHRLDMQCLVVLVAPAGIQFAKLSVLIRFDLSGCTILLVTAPQIDECHVLTLIHLSKDCGEIRLFIAGISSVGTWLMAVYQFVDRIVRDPFRKRIRQLFAPFKSANEVVDSRFTCTELFSQFLVAQAQCIPFDNDALVI